MHTVNADLSPLHPDHFVILERDNAARFTSESHYETSREIKALLCVWLNDFFLTTNLCNGEKIYKNEKITLTISW